MGLKGRTRKKSLEKKKLKKRIKNVLGYTPNKSIGACCNQKHKLFHKEPDYTAHKYVLKDRIALRDLKDQSDGAIFVKCNTRTGKDLW